MRLRHKRALEKKSGNIKSIEKDTFTEKER